MTPIAPHISAFLRERLPMQRGASAHTCDSYACSFILLFEFASQRFGVAPSELALEQIDAALVMDFLAHLEAGRGNSPIHAMFDSPPSSPSCTLSNIASRPFWNRVAVSWRSRPRKPTSP